MVWQHVLEDAALVEVAGVPQPLSGADLLIAPVMRWKLKMLVSVCVSVCVPCVAYPLAWSLALHDEFRCLGAAFLN